MTHDEINKLLDGKCEMDAQKGKAGTAPRARCLLAKNLLVSILLALLLSSCAAHKPVKRRDLQPPAPYCDGKCEKEPI